jgi:Pyruvate/2-oxoacid:ferredoxin oxidoreductase delta subunit
MGRGAVRAVFLRGELDFRQSGDILDKTSARVNDALYAKEVLSLQPYRNISESFHELYETPEVLKPYLYKLVTPEEEELLLFLRTEPKSAAQVAARFGVDEQEAAARLRAAYHRANIHKSRGNDNLYHAATLYDRLGYFTQYEQTEWRTIPSDERRAIDEWYVNAFTGRMKKQMDDEGEGFYRDAVLPIREALEAIDAIGEEKGVPFYMVPCNCRTTTNACDFSRNTCVANYYGVNGQWDRGYGKRLSKEELHALMESCDREGLMHVIAPSGHICNCDTCCCYEFRAAEKLKSKGLYPRVPYVAEFVEERCVQCGLCTKRCHFKAFRRNVEEKITFDPERCYGCGICATTCPKEAIRIVPTGREAV